MSQLMKKRFPSLTSIDLESDGNTAFLRAARNGQLDKVLEYLKQNIDINTSNANGLNALHLASKDGHADIVAELLRRGAAVDAATKKGNTALHIASLAGQEEVVRLLVQHGAAVNVQSQNGFTPLYMAAQENHDNVVRYLLASGANQSLSTEDGFTPLAVAMQQGHDKVVTVLLENDTRGKIRLPALHIAAKKDDVKAAKLLLENDHNPDVTSKSGFTPLHIAAHYGNRAVGALLLERGADPNRAAKHQIAPLHVAAKWGKSAMAQLLLDKGAAVDARTRDGLTPLHCAARSGHEQVVDTLIERGAPITAKTKNGLAPLHMAAQGDHVDAARILLYHRAPVDDVTVDYLTALHVAAHCGHARVAKLLLDRGADADARALNGFTPLHIACKKNRIKVVELLLKHGANIAATTESGLTPLHVASFMGCMNIVIYLLQHDANPDAPTVRGETPLHLAARANQTDIIRILLRNGAQVDARAREKQTPLHIASRLGNVDIVMLLLQHGAKVDNTTKDNYTALHIAAREGQDEVAAVLLDNGASPAATTKKGLTPLHLAAKHGHLGVARLLLQKEAPVDVHGKNGVTPLHVAAHYDHQDVALLLLDKGASPHSAAKNGHTPLHVAARKNQMDIAHALLEFGAKPDVESKAGFTPLHLAAQEGHQEMVALLLENKANVNHEAKNGLTPLHLAAQEDHVPVCEALLKAGADANAATKGGYTPLHVAAHYGRAGAVRTLLAHGAKGDTRTSMGYTPLHQAAQQGHAHIVDLLLENGADPNAVTANGQTPLDIAQKLGYITVIETLKVVTTVTTVTTTTTTNVEEKYRVQAPELMHETFMSDSEEEGEDTVLGDHTTYRYLTADEMKSLGDDSLPIDVTRDERIDSNRLPSTANGEPPQHIEDAISPEHVGRKYVEYVRKCDNVDNIGVHPVNIGFLVSFLVDARGGAMRGRRASGVRVIVPPRSAASPTRVTCRYVRAHRAPHHPAAPPLMEGEALASRVIEMGPVGAKFLGPVIIEVPHFAALRGKEREIVILRSDNGESWKEHTVEATEEVLNEVLHDSFEAEDLSQLEDVSSGRITRIVTQDFPQYFAVVSRVRQEVHAIGPEGGMVSSTVVPQVQAVFPEGALTKKIKVGLQAQPIDPELTAKLLGHGVAVSPVVTVEPRRRKFHKAITLSMPAPRAHSQGMINQYSGSAPTLRLLCSITGGTTRAQWEDVTGSTPLTFVNDCVSFTTTVSARFWLMDCRNIGDATKMATELYREAIHVPFMAKFVVFAKRVDPLEARLRVFCMTDDKEDKTLEHQEHFTEVAKSRDVEVLEGKPQYVEFAGNLVPVTKSGDQLSLPFRAFRENRLPFSVRVKDPHAEAVGRCLFMKEPKVPKGEPPQQPVCILNIVLPEEIVMDTLSLPDMESLRRNTFITENFDYYRPDPRLADMSNLLGEDWVPLANQLGLTASEINVIKSEYPDSVAKQAQSMLRMWLSSQTGNKAQTNTLENALRRIGREDIIPQCLNPDHQQVTRIREEKQDIVYRLKGDEEKRVLKEQDEGSRKIIDDQAEVEKRGKKDKYSAEEKVIESPEEEEEPFDKPVAERREKIEKRLSAERTIPASSQRREIVQEITTIKQERLVEDKIAEVQQKVQEQSRTEETTKTTTTTTKVSPETGKTITKTVETVKATVPPTSTVLVTGETTTTTITTVESRTTQPEQRITTTTHKVSEDAHLLEGVTESFEKVRKAGPKLIADEEPRSPKLSKTPPPSPADFLNRDQTTTVHEWETTKQEIKSPALDGVAAQKGKTTTTTQQVPIVDKPLSPTLNGLSTRISKPNAIFDQTTALIESESRGEPYNPRTEAHYLVEETKLTSPDASKDDKKRKKGILGTIKNIVGKSFDSDSDSEKSPKKEKRDKKQRTKPTGKDAPPEAPVRPPRKPKSPTPTLERKYENIPYVEATPSAANDERETYVTSITIPVTDLDESRTYVNTEVLDTAVPVASRKKETVIVQETFTKTIQPLRIEEKEFTIIIDPSQKDKPEAGYEEVASPPVRPPRHKAHVYEDISQPLTDVKKSTTDLIESEASDRADREDKSGFEDKHGDSQKGKRKYGKLFGLFGKSKDVEESDDDSSRAEVIEKHDKETSKEDTSVVSKSEEQKSPKMKSKSKEKDDKTFLSIFKKKQERPAFSDAVIKDMIDSTAFLKEEVEKYHDVKRHSPEPKAQLVVSESFTDALSTNSETIIPISKDHDVTTTIEEIETQPVIQEVTTVKVTEKIEHPAESEISPRHTKREGKGGFLGLFKKNGSEEPDSKDATRREELLKTQTETDSFLKGEISNYHDVRPVVEKPTADKEKSIVMKEVTIMREDKVSISKDHDVTATTKEIEIQPVIQEVTTVEVTEKIEHPAESETSPRHTKREGKGGFLGLFKKKGSEEPDSKDVTRQEEFLKTQTETDSFLKEEISNYHDVRPVVEKSTADKEKSIVMKEVTIMREDKVPISKDHDITTTTKEIKTQPVIQEVTTVEVTEKIEHPAERETSPRHTKREGKGGFLGLFKKKGSEEPDSKDATRREEFLKTQTETDSFLKGEVSNYHDVRPVVEKSTADKEKSIVMKEVTIMREDKVPISKDHDVTTTTKEIEIQPVIQEVTPVEVTVEHPAESEISPRHTKREGKGGFLGLFKKKGSEEPDSKDLIRREEFLKTQTETDSFLKGEVSNYHDVRPVVEKSTADKEKSILVKEVIIMKEDKVAAEKTKDEKPGLLGLFRKEEPKIETDTGSDELVKTQIETNSFLENEVSNYHDVRPLIHQTESDIAEIGQSATTKDKTISREEKPIQQTTKKDVKGGFLGIFKKKAPEIEDTQEILTTSEPGRSKEDVDSFLKTEVSSYHDVKSEGKEKVVPSEEPVIMKEIIVIRQEDTASGITSKFGSKYEKQDKQLEQCDTLKTKEDTDKFVKNEIEIYHDVKPVTPKEIMTEKPHFKELKEEKMSPKKTKKEGKKGLLGLFAKKESDRASPEKLDDKEVTKMIDDTDSFLQKEVELYHDERQTASELHKETVKNLKDENKLPLVYKETIIIKEECPQDQMRAEDIEAAIKAKTATDSFLRDEVNGYNDVRPMATEKSLPLEEDVPKGVSLVEESVKQENKQISPKKARKENAGGFLGIFKKSKDDQKSEEPQQDDSNFVKLKLDTFEFLKSEVDKHHDVRPIIKDAITESRDHTIQEETGIQEERLSPKKVGKEEEKSGILKLFKKKGSEEKELKRRSLEREKKQDVGYIVDKKIMEDTNSFLKGEVSRYHDVRPVVKEKLTSSEQASAEPELSMEEVAKVEQSPKKGKRDEERTGILGLFKKKGSEEKELKRRSVEKELQQKLEHEDNIKIRENTNSFLVHEVEKHDDVKPVISQTAVNIEPHTKAPVLAKEKDSPKKSIKHEEKGGILRIFKKKGSEEIEPKREDKAEHEGNLKVRQDTKEFLDKEVDKFHDVRPAPTHVVTTETSTAKMEAHIETGRKDEEKSGILGFFKKKGSEEKELKRRSLEDKSAEETVMKEEKISPKKSRNAEKAIFSGIFKKKESSMDSDLKDDSEEAIKVIQDTSSFLTQEVDKYEDVRPIVKEAAVESEIYKITEEPVIMKETIVIKEEISSGAKTKTKISKLESEVSEGLTKVKEETDKVVKSEEQILWEEKVSKEEKGGFLSLFKRKEHDVRPENESGEAEIKIRKETDTFLQDEINRYHDVKPLITTPRTVEHVQDSVDAEKIEERIERKEKDGGGFLGLFKKKDPEELKEQNRLEKERQIKTRNDTDMFLSEEIDKYHDVRPIVNEKAIAEATEKCEAEPVVVKETIVEQVSTEAVIKQPKEDVASPKPSKKVGKGILGLLGWKSHDEGDEKDITLHSEQLAKIKRETDKFIDDEITWYHDVRPVITQHTIEKPMQSPIVYKETMVLKQEGTSVSPKPRKKEGKGILRLFEKKGSEDRESVCKKDSLEEPIKVKEDTDSFIKQEIDKYHDVRPKIIQEVPKESEGISIVTKETVVLREAKQDSPSPKSKKRHSKGLLGLFEKKGSEDKGTTNYEELEQLVKIRKETDTFLKDEVDKYHDVPPKVKEQNDETSITIATLNKEATVEGKASPQQKKKEGKGVFGIFAKKDVKATHSIDPADSEQPLKIKDDTDTFLKDEINRYHDVKPAAEGNFTEEHVDRDTSAIAEKVTLSPKSKKRDGKGILGWFSKKGSEERDIVNTTEAQQLLKLRQDTEEFLKDEIDKFHDVRPTITENLVIKMTEEPKEKPTIIKETIVIKEDDVSLLPRDQKNSAVGSDDIMKVKKDTDKFLKDEIDRFYDVRSEKKTDDFQREETDKNRDVKPLVEDKVQTASEQSVILSKASVTEESQVAVKKEDTGGLLGIFKRKHADHGELKEQEKHDQTKAETSSFLEKEIDVYHDAKPVTKQDVTDHNIVTEGSISRILEEPVIMRETIVIRDETQTAKKDKEKDGKGKFLHIFKKKSHSGDHVDQLEHEQEVKIRTETDEFLKTEVDKFHDARPIVKEEARETLETTPESFEATTKKEEGKGGILAFFTKKASEEPLKEEIGRHDDAKPILAQDMSQAGHAERSSPEKQKLVESGLASMLKKKTSDDTVDKKINEQFVKTKSQTDSFLKGEVDKYHDAKPPIKIIEEKITIELDQPMVLEKTIIITEQETPGKQQLAQQQEASAEGHLPEIKVQTDKFLREEVDRYDDVKEAKTMHVATVPKKDDEDSDKGGFFGFFKKKGSEDRELNEKSSVTPIKETVTMQQGKTSPRKGKRDEAKGIFGIFKKKGSEERETKVQEKNLEKDQFEEAKVESDKFIQGEVEMYHDVRPTLKEKMVNEEDSVIKDMPMVKDTDTITKPKVEKSDGVTERHSKVATKDESETVKECKKESPKPTSKEHGKGGLFGIFKKKDHKGSISKDELEDNAKIRNETDVFLQDEINKYHDVHQVTNEGTADDSKSEKQIEKGVLSGLIKKGGGTDKEMEDKKRVVFKEDLEETQEDQPKRMTEHLQSQEATTGEKLDDKRKEREVGDEDFMILTPGQVDSLKEIEIHRITEETIRVKEGTAVIKTESIAISSPEKEAVKEDVQKDTSKTEGVQPHLSDRVVRQMIDTSDFIREEVARYEDVRPITRSADVEAKIEEPSTKGPKLFGLFSKKKSQDESAEKDKTKSKKKKEEPEATHAASESKDFSQKEVDRFHGKEGKESGSGFFGLFSKKTKPQEKSAKYDGDGSQVISTQTLQTMKDSSDFLQNEVALYHDVRYVPDKVLTDIEIFEPIIMSPIDVSEKTLQNINECNKFIHEEVDGIPESVLKEIRDSKEDEHTLESPTRTVTYTTKVEPIPHGERTTRVSEEVITGTIHLGPDVLSDLTKLEDEINKKLEQIRKETRTEESGPDTTTKHSDSMQTTKSEKVDRVSQERPSPHKEPEEQMFTKSGSPFKLFGRKMSEEEVKRLQEEEHSIPGTYRVKDEDQVEDNSIKISKESLKKMQDTQDFLSTELDNYESGKPEVITDLDDEIEKSKSSGIFSIFGKKDSSPKPTKKKVKKQKSGKRDESQAEDSKRTGKAVSGILGKIGEKISGKTEAHKIEELTNETSRESSLEKEASTKDTAEVIKSLENIQSTVQSAYDETSSFAGELIKKFEDKLDESHSEIKKQSESLKKSIDEDDEQKIRSESKSPVKEVGEIQKEINGTAKYLEKKATDKGEHVGKTIQKDAIVVEAVVASSVQNVEDVAEAARDNLQTSHIDTQKIEDEVQKELIKIEHETATTIAQQKQKALSLEAQDEIEERKKESKGFLGKLAKKIDSAMSSTSKAVESGVEATRLQMEKEQEELYKAQNDGKKLIECTEKSAKDRVEVIEKRLDGVALSAKKTVSEAKTDIDGGFKKMEDRIDHQVEKANKVAVELKEGSEKAVQEAGRKQKELESDVVKAVDETKKKSRGFLGKLGKKIESAVSSTTKHVDDSLTSTEAKVSDGVSEVTKDFTKSASQIEKDVQDKFEEARNVVKDTANTEAEKMQQTEAGTMRAAKEVGEKLKESEAATGEDVDKAKKKGKGLLDRLSKKIESAVSGTGKVVDEIALSADTEIQDIRKASNKELEKSSKDIVTLKETTQDRITSEKDSVAKSLKSAEEGVEGIAKDITDFAAETKKEIEDRGRESGKAIRGQVTAAEIEIQKSMTEVDEAVEQIKKETQSNINEAVSESKSALVNESEATKRKGKGFLGKLSKKLSGKKDISMEKADEVEPSSDIRPAKAESVEKTGITGKADQVPDVKADEESEKKLMSHSNVQHIFSEPAMSDIKQRTIDFIESESLKVDDPKMTRTLSDYGCQLKEQPRIPGARKISEVNMDLSNLPSDAGDFSPLSDKAHSYVTSPSSARRTHSVHLSKTERPEIVELSDSAMQESTKDEFYIITEPREVITTVTTEIRSKNPLFHIESEEDDSLSKSEDDQRDKPKSNVLDTLAEQSLETLISDMTRGMEQSIESVQCVIKKEEKKLMKHKVEAEADVDAIEKKLRDLDTALDSLEQIQTKTETVTIIDTKTEKKLKRVERKFERMASEVLEKEKTDAKQKQMTSPEVEERQETEYRELVSQLSTDEITDFQKEYSHLWDEHTFSKSSDWESKTPDSQADVQELPKGEVVYMAPVKLNKDTLVNKAGIEVDVIPIMRSPCVSPKPRKKKKSPNNDKRAKSEMGFYSDRPTRNDDHGSLPDLKSTTTKGSLYNTILQMKPQRFLSTESLISGDTITTKSLSSEHSLPKGVVMNAVVSWLQKSSPFSSTDNIDHHSSVADTVDTSIFDEDDLLEHSEISKSEHRIPDIFILSEDEKINESLEDLGGEVAASSSASVSAGARDITTSAKAEGEESLEKEEAGKDSRKVADQHQLSDEMRELLKELEKESKQ